MKIPADPFILELLPEFIEQWIADIDDQFDVLVTSKNAEDMYRFGHTIKGSCLQFGLDDIAALGIELMGYCKEENWDKILPMGQNIRNSFLQAQKMFDKA